ncbi:hypothetical protein [Streptomyces sp. YGL11-2]|uniref:hypothetical protein n=1 Tax=Streptomyces sp. YGL11-2 TaxID=3414028 RepID=UPI003CF410BA
MPLRPWGSATLFTAPRVALSATTHVLLSRAPLPPAAVRAGVRTAAYPRPGRTPGHGRPGGPVVADLPRRGGELGPPPTRPAAHSAGPLPPAPRWTAPRPLLAGRLAGGLPAARPLPLLVHGVARRGPPVPAAV